MLGTPLLSNGASETDPLLSGLTNPTRSYNLARILPALWIGSFLCALDGTIVATTMTSIASSFGQEDMVSWVATLYLLTNTAFQPLYGRVLDIMGRKAALLFAQFWFATGCLLCCFARSVPEFAVARGIAGIGGGGLPALLSIIVSDMVTLQERGLYQGYSGVVFCVGQVLGGPLGGLMVQTIGWRWMFAVQVPFVVVAAGLSYVYVDIELHHESGTKDTLCWENLRRIDFGGALTLVTLITSGLFLLSASLSSVVQVGLGLLLVVSLGLFLHLERTAAEPIIPPRLFSGSLGLTAVMAGLGTVALYSGLFMVPMYLQITQNFSEAQSGGLIGFAVVSTAVGPLLAGRMLVGTPGVTDAEADRLTMVQAKRIALVSVGLEVVGSILLLVTEAILPVRFSGLGTTSFMGKALMALGLSLCGFGFGCFLLALLIFVIARVGKSGQAPATGMNYLFRAVGSVVGVAVALAVYKHLALPRLSAILATVPGGEKIYVRLVQDTGYLKTGHLAMDLRKELTEVYQYALVRSLVPAVVSAVVALILGVILYLGK